MCRFLFSLITIFVFLWSPRTAHTTENPPILNEPAGFSNFVGTWTLKDDKFQLVWDGETVETLDIPNHITVCTSETTASSISCVVDGGGLRGQIFWVADDDRRTLHHLSHFGESRMGVGTGTISSDGSLKNKVVFSDEPAGTYRIYEYSWVSANEYHMMSRQYDAEDKATGNWYGGNFVRVED